MRTNKQIERVVEVQNISKHFLIQDDVKKDEKTFHALDAVSFTLYRGDAMSIIGSNGSGKSTLLKILSSITKPTEGEVRIYGTVTSILEVGNNFHPDLTGLENAKIQLNLSQIPSQEYGAYFEKVKAFSGIDEFFDQPVKLYSSGMFLRLAFSLAFYLAKDILILDEILSVGDEGFRLKCYDLIKELTQSGKTILFVTHNKHEVLELSNKCLWLEKGKVKQIGSPHHILGEYYFMHRDNFDGKKPGVDIGTRNDVVDGTINVVWNEYDAPSNEIISIRGISVCAANGGKLFSSTPIKINFSLFKKKSGIQIGTFFFLEDIFYQPVMVGHFLNNKMGYNFNNEIRNKTGPIEITCTIPAQFIIPGKYFFYVRFGMEENEWSSSSKEAFRFSEKLNFIVHPSPNYIDFVDDITKGSVRPPMEWEVKFNL